MLPTATSSEDENDGVASGLAFDCPAQVTHLIVTQNWLVVWTRTARNKLVTGILPLHPWHVCDGRAELVAHQESGGAGALMEMPRTDMSAS